MLSGFSFSVQTLLDHPTAPYPQYPSILIQGSLMGPNSLLQLYAMTSCRQSLSFSPTQYITLLLRLHKLVLDHLGVVSVAVAIGGSMGGMAVLEWPLCTPPNYVRHVVPIATSARHSAWCISWGEAQRQSIYSDPNYADGYYSSQPASGLAAACMAALLTYRSRDSFEKRFGRKYQLTEPPPQPPDALSAHNDGHKNSQNSRAPSPAPNIFSAQSYLRYQGDKFIARFDANCYIHITRKMDTHDLSRDRHGLAHTLSQLPRGALVICIATDGLFTTTEQREIAAHIPDSELVIIPSQDGHDGFLLEFEAINNHVMAFLKKQLPEVYNKEVEEDLAGEGFEIKKTSIFGEAEVDITQW